MLNRIAWSYRKNRFIKGKKIAKKLIWVLILMHWIFLSYDKKREIFHHFRKKLHGVSIWVYAILKGSTLDHIFKRNEPRLKGTPCILITIWDFSSLIQLGLRHWDSVEILMSRSSDLEREGVHVYSDQETHQQPSRLYSKIHRNFFDRITSH